MDASERRAQMVDRLVADETLRSAAVEAALRTVPRHVFVEGVGAQKAYANHAVPVKTDPGGTAISSLSQPTIVAAMLELMALEPGQRVLEIGTGTGYNAALLASIVGARGTVITVELEADLAASAKTRLAGLGFDNVTVIDGDGALGHQPAAPFDRIVVTTGAQSVEPAWVEQLGDAGRLVVPIVDTEGIGLVHCLEKVSGGMIERATTPCGFLVMRTQ